MQYLPRRASNISQSGSGKGAGGLSADSVILGEQVRVLDKRRLLRRRGELETATMARLNEALRIAFDLD